MMNFLPKSNCVIKIWLLLTLFPILIIHACTADKPHLVYVGTYTGNGSDGIYLYRFNPETGELGNIGLAATTDNPSFITIDSSGRFLYAVNELDSFQNKPTGAVSVFAINRKSGKLKFLQQISSLGAAPAHLSLDRSGRYLLVANYNGGNVAVFPVKSDGQLGPQTSFIQNEGAGMNADRQAGPHAHFIQVTNDNKFVMVVDLGIDKVLVYLFDSKTGTLTPTDSGFIKLAPGSGPRHIAFSPSRKFVYVVNELSSKVTVFSFETENGMMEPKQTLSSLPNNFSGLNTAAEIAVDAKGKFLYVSNRGDNSIGLFAINSIEGSLTPVEWISSGGKTPRHFEIDPTGQWMIVSNQNSDNMVVFRIDQRTGRLTETSMITGINSPVCIRCLSTK